MPRISRHEVLFTVDGVEYSALFKHQHAKEAEPDKTGWVEQVDCPVYEDVPVKGGVLGSQVTERILVRMDYDSKVVEPIVEKVPMKIEGAVRTIDRKLRHVTTCQLAVKDSEGSWMRVGEGSSRCSVKDKYRWKKGIKDSFVAAVKEAGHEAKLGQFLHSYYDELRKRA